MKRRVVVLAVGLASAIALPGCREQWRTDQPKRVVPEEQATPKEQATPEAAGPSRAGARSNEGSAGARLGESCRHKGCAPGLTCHPRMKECLADACELGSSSCKKGTICCPLPAALFASPLCLPDCRGKLAAMCRQLMGDSAECNTQMGCCHYSKVRGPLRRP